MHEKSSHDRQGHLVDRWIEPCTTSGFENGLSKRNNLASAFDDVLAGYFLIAAHTSLGHPRRPLEKAKSYFAEIDKLLLKEKNWIMPFVELNERYSPLEGCDTDLLLQEKMAVYPANNLQSVREARPCSLLERGRQG